MSIVSFVKSLIPRIERNDVAEDLRASEKELSGMAIPAWSAACEHFKINRLKSDETEVFTVDFYRFFDLHGARKDVNFVCDISRRLGNFSQNLHFISSVLDSAVERDILSSGLTMPAAFVIRSAANISFVSRYLLSLLNYLYMCEARAVKPGEFEDDLEISKAEVKYVQNNFATFVKLFSEYSEEPSKFSKAYKAIPEIFVGNDNDVAKQAVTEIKADPLEQLGLAGFIGNPIYQVRMVIARWQNERYESAKAKKQQLELRLLYLKSQSENSEDPAVIREIERLQSRIESYDRSLRETEESLGV